MFKLAPPIVNTQFEVPSAVITRALPALPFVVKALPSVAVPLAVAKAAVLLVAEEEIFDASVGDKLP